MGGDLGDVALGVVSLLGDSSGSILRSVESDTSKKTNDLNY